MNSEDLSDTQSRCSDTTASTTTLSNNTIQPTLSQLIGQANHNQDIINNVMAALLEIISRSPKGEKKV
jgi:hypothetical protein